MTYSQVVREAEAAGLLVMGALHPENCRAKQLKNGTLILLGAGAGFWPVYSTSPEALDGHVDPIDRWSLRVVGDLARRHGTKALYPFGGPPYAPFIDWALKSGRAFTSPTGMMVHEQVGMMISYRGALHFSEVLDIPEVQGTSPCSTCSGQPCVTTCPVSALGKNAKYDLGACHNFLDSKTGESCMILGCAARRACPTSAGAMRQPGQSAHHMRAFHPAANRVTIAPD